MAIVLLKATPAKHALIAKAGLDSSQAGVRQHVAVILRIPVLAVQVGPAVVAVNAAPLRCFMHLPATLPIAVPVLVDGRADHGNRCQAK